MTTGIVPDWGDSIEVKNEDQIQGLRQACQLARHVLLLAGKSLKVALHQVLEGLQTGQQADTSLLSLEFSCTHTYWKLSKIW